MSKTYNRVQWKFLKTIMRKLGFNERWVKLIMDCVRTVTYSILINGQAGESFKPSRRLRQRDPLSPYLFILCAEWLSMLLSINESKGGIRRVIASRGAAQITHLLFAYDYVIFSRATQVDWQRIFNEYEAPSGQVLNKHKTSIQFSTNTREQVQSQIIQVVESMVCVDHGKYLGLPIMGRLNTTHLGDVKRKCEKRFVVGNQALYLC